MKKQLILTGLLSIGFAHAQEGKIGINTDEPKATLDIVAHKTDGSNQEGILIPRVGKTAVAKMASPVTSTVVYINNTDYATGTDTNADTRVEKVNTVGFYHYNGTQWIKISDATTEFWAQKEAGNIIETFLTPAQEKGDFVGYKFQKNDTTPDKKYRTFSLNLGNPTENDFKNGNGSVGIAFNEIPFSTNITSDVLPKTSSNGGTVWHFTRNSSLLKNEHAQTDKSIYYGGEYRLVAKDIEKLSNLNVVRGLQSSVELFSNSSTDKDKASSIIGFAANTRTGSENGTYKPLVTNNTAGEFTPRNYGTVDNLIAIKGILYNYNTAKNMRGLDLSSSSSQVANPEGNHTVTSIRGINNTVKLSEKGILASGGEIVTTYNTVEVAKNSTTPSGTNIRGNYNRVFINGDTVNKTTISSAITNYTSTINTNGLNEIKEYVDFSAYPNSTSEATNIATYTGFRINTGSSTNKMTVGTMYGLKVDDLNKATTNYAIHTGAGKVYFGDDVESTGTIKARTFTATATGSVFPDYVFQKYYTGASSIKEDYNFQSLNQVENFVKTNGHLPGYKSAETIKKQGYVDLAETQLTNVEKIEELYLHLIEKDKEIKNLQNQNEELKSRLERLEKLIK